MSFLRLYVSVCACVPACTADFQSQCALTFMPVSGGDRADSNIEINSNGSVLKCSESQLTSQESGLTDLLQSLEFI